MCYTSPDMFNEATNVDVTPADETTATPSKNPETCSSCNPCHLQWLTYENAALMCTIDKIKSKFGPKRSEIVTNIESHFVNICHMAAQKKIDPVEKSESLTEGILSVRLAAIQQDLRILAKEFLQMQRAMESLNGTEQDVVYSQSDCCGKQQMTDNTEEQHDELMDADNECIGIGCNCGCRTGESNLQAVCSCSQNCGCRCPKSDCCGSHRDGTETASFADSDSQLSDNEPWTSVEDDVGDEVVCNPV